MRIDMRSTLSAVAAGFILSACGGTTTADAGTDAGNTSGFQQPAGTVAVNFTIDDTANKVFKTAGDLDWKGSMTIDTTTRKITKSGWDGPFPTLYDDGPWNAGGHEPAGSTAGDSKWGVTVFATPPATGEDIYEYGAQDHTTMGWIWRGSNGTFKVASGATAAITATGLTLPAFGNTDVKLVLDTTKLLSSPQADGGAALPWDSSKVEVKGSAWAWTNVELKDDGANGDDTAGDKKYTFILSSAVGAGKVAPHSGLPVSGDKPEFVFVLKGIEYKAADGKTAPTDGVSAFLKVGTGSFTTTTVSNADNGNTIVTVP